MKILIKSSKIIASDSSYNGQILDILIEGGRIIKIAKEITEKADKIIDSENLHISYGWFDAKVNFCDPGNEIKEDITTGIRAAEVGGMTAVSITPNTLPTISNKSQIDYVIKRSDFSAVEIFPYGSLTDNMEGKNLAEMFDMSESGAIGFTDGHEKVSAGIMYRGLLYSKNFGGKVVSFPWDSSVFGKGHINEGKSSVLTGLKSIPSIAEYIIVQRDLSLAEYTDAPIHFTGISTKESVDLIRDARSKGIKVTADCYVHNLIFTDEDVLSFDSHYKVLPPFRTNNDKTALISGLKDGTIDFICSDHTPEDIENKDLEFDNAAFGIIGVQTLFPLLNTIEDFTLEEKINFISKTPRQIFNISHNEIEENSPANLTLFNPDKKWVLDEKDILSKSKNSPLIGKELKGEIIGIINNGILSISESD